MSKKIGDEIRDIVQNAIHTMDFQELNKDIGNTVNSALDEVRNALGFNKGNFNHTNDKSKQWDKQKENNNISNNRDYSTNEDIREGRNYVRYNNWSKHRQPSPTANETQVKNVKLPAKKQQELFPHVPVGKISGTLLSVFGGIGIGTTVVGAFVLCLVGQLTGSLSFFGTIALGLIPLFFVALYMSSKGARIRKRLNRFYRYLRIFQNRSYYTIKELSAHIGLSKKYVIKDLRKMISIGMFPEGYIDEQETCLILSRESYNQYLDLQKSIQMRNFEQHEKNKSKDGQSYLQEGNVNSSVETTMDTALRTAIEDGRACIRQIKEANDMIPGEEISNKLNRLEEIIEKIFNYVELHPAQLPEIQKFMDYYLPTTLKLVNTYKEFDKHSIQGINITTAKTEIEDTLDTINHAFEKLFDSLFINVAMDVSTDISVLETLFAQEGLTQKDFKTNRTIGGLTNEL